MSKNSWQFLEEYLEKIAKRCGFRYLRASTGDSQMGGDGGGTLIIEKYEFYWKFECKQRVKSIDKPIVLNEISDKILEIMSQDRTNWPDVLCLFTPHHTLYDQLERKINALEKNKRIPFKVVIWHYKYLIEVLHILLEDIDIKKIYPDLQLIYPSGQTDKDLLLAKFIAEIENKTKEGHLIKNSYIHAEDLSYKTIKLVVNVVQVEEDGENKKLYEINMLNEKFLIKPEDIDNIAIKKVPIAKHQSVNSTSSVTNVNDSTIRTEEIGEIEVVDWNQRNKDIDNKRRQIIDLFKKLKIEGKTENLYDLLKKQAIDQKIIVKVISNDFLLNLVPFVYLNEKNFETQNQISFVVMEDKIYE